MEKRKGGNPIYAHPNDYVSLRIDNIPYDLTKEQIQEDLEDASECKIAKFVLLTNRIDGRSQGAGFATVEVKDQDKFLDLMKEENKELVRYDESIKKKLTGKTWYLRISIAKDQPHRERKVIRHKEVVRQADAREQQEVDNFIREAEKTAAAGLEKPGGAVVATISTAADSVTE